MPMRVRGFGKPFQFVIQSSASYEELNALAQKLVEKLKDNPGLTDLDTDMRLNKPEVEIKIDRNRVAALRPGIVCVSICAYGHHGPWSDRRGFDSIVQNVTGLSSVQGGSRGTPRNLPVQALDYICGYLAALGAMAGLARRIERGGSWHVRVSLVQVAHWLAGLGTVDAAKGAKELADAELAGILMESTGPLGRLRHLRPAIGLSETPPHYARPAEPLGASPLSWS